MASRFGGETDDRMSVDPPGDAGKAVRVPRQDRDVTVKGSDAILKWNQEGPQGAIDVVMTLTLKDGALTVKQDMAGGQFSQTGTGKKKG